MASRLTILLLTIVVLAIIIPNSSAGGGVAAFGAGNIPGFAYLENKAFRHGDIEDVLSELLKKSAGGGLLGLGGGSKFGGLDVKRVYFGNWLRDYSQAVDITGLKSVQLQTILNIVTVLGFLAHGYATGPFEVTAERLGTYLPVEHIDNPKGYGEGEDPRKYHPKLRPPVHPQEYAVDPNTGMKNYIANESGFWDTSKAHVRRTLEQCIHYGRQYRQSKNQDDKFEAYRLLGSALHTLEDFFAHSNFCELTLISIGGWNVFPHVGDRTKIRAPNGQYVYPLVTGTFGGSDFIHSVLGEATDHLSQSSLTELNSEMTTANKKKTSGNVGSVASIKDLSSKIPGLSSGSDMDRDIQNMERSRAGTQGKNPNEMNPQEIRNAIWPVLVFRDNLVLKIETVIEKIPGLQAILDSLIESIQVFVLTTIEPFVRPLIEAATGHLMENSAAVINSHDQYEVFSNPNASDPTHSFLSKDHFNTILNEPAGNLAKLVVMYAVPLITQAWDNPSINPRSVTEDILQCLFHPDWHDRNSKVQVQVMTYMGKWMNSHGSAQPEVVRRLGKEAVRNHENIRFQGQAQGVISAGAPGSQHPISVPGGAAAGAFGINDAVSMLGKLGLDAGPSSGPKRDAGGGYYAPPSGPPPSSNAPPYGAPSYAPPPGPPPGVSSYGGGPGFPSIGGTSSYPGGSDYDRKDRDRDRDRLEKEREKERERETKDQKKARKAEEKRLKKERKQREGKWDDRDYVYESEDSEDDDYYKKKGGEHGRKSPNFPSTGGYDSKPRDGGGSSYYGGAPSGGYALGGTHHVSDSHPTDTRSTYSGHNVSDSHPRSDYGGSSYAPPSGPPPGHQGGSGFYAPPPGPPPGPSFPNMPSGPGSAPGFPSGPSFNQTPNFPRGGDMMPSAFPGMPYMPPGGVGFPAPPAPGGGPSFPGSGSGHQGSGYPGSGYPGAGGKHDYHGSSSGW